MRDIGGPIQKNKNKAALANPITYVDASDPPFLIFHGEQDPLVPPCQSQMLHDSLKSTGVGSEYILIPDGKHGPGVFGEENFKKMTDFFNSSAKNEL